MKLDDGDRMCREGISHLTRKSTHLGKNQSASQKTFTEPQNTDINTNGASSRIGSIRPNMFINNMRIMCSHLSAILCMQYAQHSSILERAKLF